MVDEAEDVGQSEGSEKNRQSHHLLSHLLPEIFAKVIDKDDV